MNGVDEAPDGADSWRRELMRREKVRSWIARVVWALLTIGILLIALLMQGSPSQPTAILGVFLGAVSALYLTEVWARTGNVGTLR